MVAMKISYSNDKIKYFGELNYITNEFNNLKLEQVDDVCVIGIKF
jgi:hypothetical protein